MMTRMAAVGVTLLMFSFAAICLYVYTDLAIELVLSAGFLGGVAMTLISFIYPD